MKSMLPVVHGLYAAIISDLQRLHPSIKTGLERDFTRLRKGETSRGLPFYTIDLPNAAKWFQLSLSMGSLQDPRPVHFGTRSKRDKRPAMLGSLFELVFEADGKLQSDCRHEDVASIRQLLLAAKKLRLPCKDDYIENAINDFVKIERSLPTSRRGTWDDTHPSWGRGFGHPIHGELKPQVDRALELGLPPVESPLDFNPKWDEFRLLCRIFVSSLGHCDPFEIRPKHGPGAVSDNERGYVKYDLPYWTEKLQAVFPYDWHAAPNAMHLDYMSYREFPSRLLAVPKDQSGPRLIAAEPTSHQWIQQGIFRWLDERLPRTFLGNCIDFRDQGVSRRLALEGSADGSLATVDLKSASDRLTTRLVEAVFEGNYTLLDMLHASRTRAVKLPNGEQLLLRKFATQGSALTFPIQSIVFSLISVWAVLLSGGKGISKTEIYSASRQVRVFGDDIIVPTHAYPVLVALLESLFLKVNTQKSHATGFFRESCGMDAYAGVDVTPAYLREAYSPSPTSLESIVECSNNFFRKGYWLTSDYLLKTVPIGERKNLPVVGEDDGYLGLFSFCGSDYSHLPRRWNSSLHQEERRVLVTRSKVTKRDGQGNGGLTQFFFEEPDPLLPYGSGQIHRVTPRKGYDWVLSVN